MSTRATRKGRAASAKAAAPTKRANTRRGNTNDVKDEPVILQTTSTAGDGNTILQENEEDVPVAPPSPPPPPPVVVSSKPKPPQHNHWTEDAENQLTELISVFRAQGYSGPILWELISSKCDYNFTAEQCMSKWYREKTKERKADASLHEGGIAPPPASTKSKSKKRKEPSSTSTRTTIATVSTSTTPTVKWDVEGTERLNNSVELIKRQDYEGSKLWNLVSESLDSKWTASQCMNKYYRDRHKLQKLEKK
jgi:hypothetical protein